MGQESGEFKVMLVEDDVFFPASRTYFSETEDQAMLMEFWEFDRKMIHEKYKAVVQGLGAK